MGRCTLALRAACAVMICLCSMLALGQDLDMGRNGQEKRERNMGDEKEQRDLWFHRGRTVKGKSAAELLQQARQQKAALQKSKLSQQRVEKYIQSNLKWKNLGPAPINSDQYGDGFQDYGPVTGRATAVAVDQTDVSGNTVYVAGAYGGVWKSTNAATADPKNVVWKQLLDNQASLAVGAVAVKPNDGNIILAGTGEPNNAGDSYYGVGMLRSTDGGLNWTLIGSGKSADGATNIPFKGMGFSRIVFSPDNPNLVLASVAWTAKDLGSYTNGSYRGVYYSTDAGATWKKASFANPDGQSVVHSAYGLAYNPSTKHWFVSLGYRGFYTSTDGISWTRLANQPGGAKLDFAACPTAGAATCVVYRSEIAVRQNINIDKGELYAWYVDANGANQGVYLSTDDGATWTSIDVTGMNCAGEQACGTAQGTYNLTMAAVPNGTSTDLIAGAVNLFKTTVTCTAGASCTADGFKNLTHVYGCYTQTGTVGTLAHVHPDQHGIDFSKGNAKVVYFANDGGIYRTLDNPNLKSSDCTVSNPFDNLNATMGSMTQFVSFSQTPSDTSILLAGSQDNGTETTNPSIPDTDKGASGLGWTSYQGGDGGYTAINPANPDEWFASFPFGDITRCGGGVNCRGSFALTVNYTIYGGDDSAFYTPFILDPQAPGQMILGSCRVWRGDSNPTAPWSPLSYNFYTGDATTCSVANAGMISALAAGGPKTAAGSEVIYSGDEYGYLSVTQTASQGPSSWSDATLLDDSGFPVWGSYPVSSITIDSSDATGATAYVTTQGFGTGHVWKTTNFGADWTNITGDLPDAPADGFTIDPADKNTLYVGTDVGVFTSTNGGTNWTEYGPTSGTGSFPNVAITKLEAIAANGEHKLRVSTYGRGMWEIDLATYKDFTQTITPATAKVAAGGTTTYTVNLSALGAFNSDVTVACTGLPAGATCTANPTTVGSTATKSVVTVTTTATGTSATPIGDNPFQITGTAGSLVKTSDVILHVTDFGVSATTSTATVKAGSPATYPISITTGSGHTDAVTLTCTSTLPTGVACGFVPSTLAPGGTSTLTIGTTAATTALLTVPHFGQNHGAPLFAFWFGLPGIVIAGAGARGKRKKAIMLALLVLVLISMLAMAACGGGSKTTTPTPSTSTPAGTYTVTVTGTSGALTHTATVTLVVQ